jgi:regulator of protease activity HflC (stomatin/prohibitin superfamily)
VDSMNFTYGLLLGAVLLAAWLVRLCYFRVEEGFLAVKTTFGAAEHLEGDSKRLRTWGPGLHMKRPWDKILQVQMMEHSVELSGERARTAMAADGTKLRFDAILRFQPTEDRLADYLFGMRAPREHILGLFTCLLRNEIANMGAGERGDRLLGGLKAGTLAIEKAASLADDMGSFALIRRERAQLNRNIGEFCRAEIGNRYGVRFNAVDLVDILPPDELAAALNAVIHAHTEAGGRYFRAESECEQRVLAAEEGLAIAASKAAAVEREMVTLGGILSTLHARGTLNLYVDRRRAEVLGEARSTYLRAEAQHPVSGGE